MVESERSRAAAVAEELERRVREGRLSGGTLLGRKSDLKSEYDVAAGTLDQALQLLQSRGYVRLKPGPGGGVFVAPDIEQVQLRNVVLSFQGDGVDVLECVAVRNALDPLAAGTAASACTSDDARRLKSAMDELVTAESGDDAIRANWRIHRIIAEIGDNTALTAIYVALMDVIESRMVSMSRRAPVAPGVREDTIEVHQQLVDAIVAGDPEAAEKAAHAHSVLAHPAAVSRVRDVETEKSDDS